MMDRVRLGIGDLTCGVPAHLGLFHHGDDELRALALALLRPGVDDERSGIVLFGPPGVAAVQLGWLEAGLGRSLAPEVAARRIVLAQGDADADRQLRAIIRPIEELAARGSDPIRILGITGWGTAGYPAPEDFLWYESKITAAIAKLPAVVFCMYDLTRLPAAALLYGGLETHPEVLVNGRLAENPYRVPEDQYLRDRLLTLPWLDTAESTPR
jgi:hypothetical protein